MSSKHLNNTLPIEIFIFRNLNLRYWKKKGDIKTCLFVCKSWQVAAQQYFGEMSIKVLEDNLEKLAKDVVFFANKVKHITLVESKYFRVFDRMHASTVWLDVISSCTYLTTITIRTEFASDYIIRFKMNTTANRQSLHALDFVQFLKAAPRVKEFDAETLCEIKSDWRTVIPANLS